MRLASGLYCYDLHLQDRVRRGESVRYSLMVLLGLQRAQRAGLGGLPDLDELWGLCLDRRASFTPGDIGLALWADSRRDGSMAVDLIAQLERALSSDSRLASLVGMEIAWILIGLAHASRSARAVERPLERVAEHLQRERRATSGLYFTMPHRGSADIFRTSQPRSTHFSRWQRSPAMIWCRSTRVGGGSCRAHRPPSSTRWRMALALRRRPRRRRRAVRDLHGPPGCHGPDGPSRAHRSDSRSTLGEGRDRGSRVVARRERIGGRPARHRALLRPSIDQASTSMGPRAPRR